MPKDKTPATRGRPKIASHLRRAQFVIRLSPEERALLDLGARREGMELSTWIRTISLKEARKRLAA